MPRTSQGNSLTIYQCRVYTNVSTRSLPAFQTIDSSDFYQLNNTSNAPCYMTLIIDYSQAEKRWHAHIYDFNNERLPIKWLYQETLKNIQTGLYSLTI